MSDKELNTGEKIFYSIIFVMIVLLLFVVVGAWIFEMTLGSVNSNTWWVYLLSSIVGWLEVAVALGVVSSPRWIWVLHANHKDNVKRFQAQREQRRSLRATGAPAGGFSRGDPALRGGGQRCALAL